MDQNSNTNPSQHISILMFIYPEFKRTKNYFLSLNVLTSSYIALLSTYQMNTLRHFAISHFIVFYTDILMIELIKVKEK